MDVKTYLEINSKIYEVSHDIDIDLNSNHDNIWSEKFKKIYDKSGDGIINSGSELDVFINDISSFIKSNGEIDDSKIQDYFSQHSLENNASVKQNFYNFLQTIFRRNDKYSNTWTVQNKQTIPDISKMILKQTMGYFSQEDVESMNKILISLNKSKLDASKKYFLVNSKIKLPAIIDISKEKRSENPTFDYVESIAQKDLNKIVNMYNLIDSDKNSILFSECKKIAIEFRKEYGPISSASMEFLLTQKMRKQTERNITLVRDKTQYGDATEKCNTTQKMVKKTGSANCAECADIINLMCVYELNKGYNTEKIYFKSIPEDENKQHVAVLVTSKDSSESYVIDPWISPSSGGIFKKTDWIKMMTKVYNTEKFNSYSEGSTTKDLEREKYFYQNIESLKNELPKLALTSPYNFAHCIYNKLKNGEKVSDATMKMFDKYNNGLKEQFNREKGFFNQRELIQNNVSKEAAMSIGAFENIIYNGLIENKKYPKEIIDLFKKYCPGSYQCYINHLELSKIKDIINKHFPSETAEMMLDHSSHFIINVSAGLEKGKEYPEEIMNLYYKYGYNSMVTDTQKKNYSNREINKELERYNNFEKLFKNNPNITLLNNYLQTIENTNAASVILQHHCDTLVKIIDQKHSGFGQGKSKEQLMLPLINYISQLAKEYSNNDYVDPLKQSCIKELDAIFYTNENIIIEKLKKMLDERNEFYNENKYFKDYS